MSGERTRWGWHRLDSRWAEQLVGDAGIRARDLVLDVGAGDGALTRPLAQCGAFVVAVELHAARAAQLRQRFLNDTVNVIRADGSDLRLPRRPFRVVANPPFGICVALLKRLTAPGSRLVRADVIVPYHVAERWVSGSPPGAARWRHEFSCRYGRLLPRSAFHPPPPHGVAVLVLERRVRGRRTDGPRRQDNGADAGAGSGRARAEGV